MITVAVRFRSSAEHETSRSLVLPVVPVIGDDLEIDGVRWVVYDRVIRAVRADSGAEASIEVHVGRRVAIDDAGECDPELDLPPVFGGGEGAPS